MGTHQERLEARARHRRRMDRVHAVQLILCIILVVVAVLNAIAR